MTSLRLFSLGAFSFGAVFSRGLFLSEPFSLAKSFVSQGFFLLGVILSHDLSLGPFSLEACFSQSHFLQDRFSPRVFIAGRYFPINLSAIGSEKVVSDALAARWMQS